MSKTIKELIQDYGSACVRASMHVTGENLHDLHMAAAELDAELAKLDAMRENAERYEFLRAQHWTTSRIVVITNPRRTENLGAFHPSGELLDFEIDAERAKANALKEPK